jgi:hypothetical protein
MDGLPLSRSPHGIGFWPILGCVDDYPVFVIGAYAGKEKPKCANEFIWYLVKEVKTLYAQGLNVAGRVYKFRLLFINMDGPATSFITGVKNPTGYYACRRCRVKGKRAIHAYTTANGTEVIRKLTIRYPNLDPREREHHDFITFAQDY